ncbi:cryptochrome/photolyase family protein [Profundibacterium mesophilum]|uniref:DNA photolyase n=1 Tax=Profundibacterium mesophilum KAUST100406-0324 TaxID=1037889 RepID=A0A921P1L1_9RHOB|nr:deoxyribodipyrimidine photo-lyase [Profundibacterium mesophilum]KAF0677543.1 DNA photolyase [Profundibacterium mesophilum KAUST100406-0324]
MSSTAPVILWLRRDFRLHDNPALAAAAQDGRPVIPVFIEDEVVETLGAAPRWRLALAAQCFARTLEGIGSKLVVRRGRARDVLRDLVRECGADTVHHSRAYERAARDRDREVGEALAAEGCALRGFEGHLLFEPGSVRTGQGGSYKVFTPYWKKVQERDPGMPVGAPGQLKAPQAWPETGEVDVARLGAGMRRGRDVVAPWLTVGAEAAADRLHDFVENRMDRYETARDWPAVDGTSGLSENLTYGEISIRSCWMAGQRALDEGRSGAATFLKELAWREFSYHILHHFPALRDENWRGEWDAFPWSRDARSEAFTAWCRGRTGVPFVDAAMRELYVTGRMHNRARMITASYLTKHLMTDWRLGERWFADCLVDWDPANNALGWQWVAGSGPDASPFFRIFNPQTQLKRFDPQGAYTARWIAETSAAPGRDALAYFDAIPRAWGMDPAAPYPDPVISLAEGRDRALEAYRGRKRAD